MKRVYFDQNVWIDIEEKRKFLSVELMQEIINHDKIQLIYSPANCEEICNAFRSKNIKTNISEDKKNKRISIISELTNNTEIIPYPNNSFNVIASPFGKTGPQIIKEEPSTCYQRVDQYYESNEISEDNQQIVINLGKNIDERTKLELSMLDPILDILKSKNGDEILRNKILLKTMYGEALIQLIQEGSIKQPITKDKLYIIDSRFKKLAKNIDFYVSKTNSILSEKNIFPTISNSYSVMETYIDSIVQTLIELGYASENKSMSSLHDISHIIYGSYCDYFVTGDEKLTKKASAAYKYINSPTQVINTNNKDWIEILKG